MGPIAVRGGRGPDDPHPRDDHGRRRRRGRVGGEGIRRPMVAGRLLRRTGPARPPLLGGRRERPRRRLRGSDAHRGRRAHHDHRGRSTVRETPCRHPVDAGPRRERDRARCAQPDPRSAGVQRPCPRHLSAVWICRGRGAAPLLHRPARPGHVGHGRRRTRLPSPTRSDSGGPGVNDTPLILGFETSCDETAVAVVRGGTVLSNVAATQVDEHARFGGVVPEVAARAHVEAIRSLAHRALRDARVHPMDLDAVAATKGPGLAGALMVGFSYGKALAWALDVPFIGVDHMEGHLFAPRFENPDYEPPAVVLLASGGHSEIVHLRGWGDYEVLGATIDDAAGEAFDKLARFLGLGYPGGPAIDRESEGGDPTVVAFPRALPDRPIDLSFSV